MIDTAEKRRSASAVGLVFMPAEVTPNATKPQRWRQSSGWSYSGILAHTPPVGTGGKDIIYQAYPPAGHSNRGIVGLGHWFRRLKTCENT